MKTQYKSTTTQALNLTNYLKSHKVIKMKELNITGDNCNVSAMNICRIDRLKN